MKNNQIENLCRELVSTLTERHRRVMSILEREVSSEPRWLLIRSRINQALNPRDVDQKVKLIISLVKRG